MPRVRRSSNFHTPTLLLHPPCCWYFLFLIVWIQCSSSIATLLFFFPKPTKITWVNGIGYNHLMMTNGQSSISSMFGGQPVLFCHNPTAMTTNDDYLGYIGDLTQAGTQKLGML